jgi:hypothetical protein
MKTFNKKLAVMILKNTTAFTLNQIGYSTFESDRIMVWSIAGDGTFHNCELVHLFAHPFSSYIQYNEEMKRCELVIF